MTVKNHPNNDSSFLGNNLIDENYNHLVLNKITKELSEASSCCSNCNELDNVENLDDSEANIVLAKCNGLLGIHFCENPNSIELDPNDDIVIKVDSEFEFAKVLETGKIVNFKKDKNDSNNGCLPIIERIANEKDYERNINNITNSRDAKKVFLDLVRQLSLEMKLVDIHFQFDRKKLFFFYTADGRVDFRELAKKLASNFKTRIELRQIGVRDEAKRLGGLATCGREFCCSSFLNNFKRITTDIAVENNISNSISKYTGPCGKLKCCLSFEIE
jgi:cell fate regulator YaaT (PSP1 superfamily)